VNENIGHQHPKVVKAIQDQAAILAFVSPGMATEPRGLLGKKLAEITPGDLKKTFFALGGAEANENAIKIARQYTGRHKILARYRSYHGATHGAIALTVIIAACPPSLLSLALSTSLTRIVIAVRSAGRRTPVIVSASAMSKR